MKGMFSGSKKDCHIKHSNPPLDEMKFLQTQVQQLQEQNMKLADEVKSLKNQEKQKVISLSKTN
jgi:hypothetical protein